MSMTSMGPLHYFLGLKIIQDASCINLSQTKYVRDLLVRFHMTKCRSTTTPFLFGVQLEDGGDTPVVDNILYRHLVGSLLYPTHTQSYLSYAVGEFFRYMQESHELHWKAVKCILIYVQGTTGYGIHYATWCALELMGFTDSNWDGDNTDHKATYGYMLNLGHGPICWSSKKQSTIALLSTEVEYRGAINITIQAL